MESVTKEKGAAGVVAERIIIKSKYKVVRERKRKDYLRI